MEAIYLGIFLSLLIELKKVFQSKLGWEFPKVAWQAGILVACILLASIYRWAPALYLEEAAIILGSAVVWYEFIWKNAKALFSK
jgi:hypothetical protein